MAGFTMSLDGYIAGPDDDVRQLFKWYGSGDTPLAAPNSDMVFRLSRASAHLLGEAWESIGALVTGRRDFEVSRGWGGKPPVGEHAFIVTHAAPPDRADTESPFTFVTDGVESAVARARAVAGDRDVAVGGSTIVRQCLEAGLLDEIHIDLASMLLGDGVRLFDRSGIGPTELERIAVVEGTDVTHLRYRVVKRNAEGNRA